MRLKHYSGIEEYAPGKTLAVADALSRGPLRNHKGAADSHSDVTAYVVSVVSNLPVSPQRMENISLNKVSDPQLQPVLWFIRNGWPVYLEKNSESMRLLSGERETIRDTWTYGKPHSHSLIHEERKKFYIRFMMDTKGWLSAERELTSQCGGLKSHRR